VVDGGAKKNGGRSPPANAKVLSPPIGRSPEALAEGNLLGTSDHEKLKDRIVAVLFSFYAALLSSPGFQSFITSGAFSFFLPLYGYNMVYSTKKFLTMERTVLYPIKPGCFKPRTDGTSNIHIQYCYTPEKKTLLDTEIIIP